MPDVTTPSFPFKFQSCNLIIIAIIKLHTEGHTINGGGLRNLFLPCRHLIAIDARREQTKGKTHVGTFHCLLY